MTSRIAAYAAVGLLAAACAPKRSEQGGEIDLPRTDGTVITVADTTIDAMLDAAGVAAPFQQATLSTKLMGTVVHVLVREGDRVTAGQPLVRIDARDLAAKDAQVAASLAEAEAAHREAQTQAARIRGLYADSAATKAQLDAVETGLVRADAGVRAARAAASELDAVRSYAVVRAPFAGLVTQRLVDAGAFAAPGAPLVTVQDVDRLRITVQVAPDAARGVKRGDTLGGTIEGRAVRAQVEGVVPASAGNLYTINAIVPNRDHALLAGTTASLALPLGTQAARLVPAAALRREGDLVGVTIRTDSGDELRWVRVGRTVNGLVEVTSGLRAGDRVIVPASAPGASPATVGRN